MTPCTPLDLLRRKKPLNFQALCDSMRELTVTWTQLEFPEKKDPNGCLGYIRDI